MSEENKTVQSDFQELSEMCVRGLRTLAQAEALQELTQRSLDKLKMGADHHLRIEERDGLFDLIVLKRIN